MSRYILMMVLALFSFSIYAADKDETPYAEQKSDKARCIQEHLVQCIDTCQKRGDTDCEQTCNLNIDNECRQAGE